MTEQSQIKNCWEASWDIWPETPKETPHGSDYVADIYPNMKLRFTKQKPIEAPEPFNEIIERSNYADASIFEAFPDCTAFDRPMIAGESWPEDPKNANAVRVILLGEGLRTRLFFFNPELST